MAERGTTLTLTDVAAFKDPSGRIGKVAEILMRSNPILSHIPWIEGNLDTGERIIQRASLGTPSWRRINEFVQPSVSRATQLDEVTGMLEDWSEVDAKLVEMAGDKEGFQLRQSTGKIEAIGQEVASTIVYGNVYTSPKEFHGITPRYDALNSAYGSPIVLDAGGSDASDNASILFVGWGEDKVYGIYPKNSMAGLHFENKGKQTKESTSGLMDVYRSHYTWECGLAVADPRYIVRIANIDVSSLASIGTGTDTSADLFNMFIDALSFIPNPEAVNLCAYGPRKVWAALSKKANEYGSRSMTVGAIDGKKLVTDIMGVPFYMMDSMLVNEAPVA